MSGDIRHRASPDAHDAAPSRALGATTSYDLKSILSTAQGLTGTVEPVLTVLAGRQLGMSIVLTSLPVIVGREASCRVCLSGRGISREHARLECDRESGRVVIVDLDSTNGVVINGTHVRRRLLEPGDLIRLGPVTTVRFDLEHTAVVSVAQRKYEESIRDGLTGLYNRRHFDAVLDQEVAFAWRHEEHLSVLIIDLDDFKRVNDRLGHPGGDRVLATVAAALARSLRTEDLVARLGGEEFAVVLRGQDGVSALDTAQRLRATVESLPIDMDYTAGRVTASIGVASLDRETAADVETIMALADRRLYRAKHGGRNRCVGAS